MMACVCLSSVASNRVNECLERSLVNRPPGYRVNAVKDQRYKECRFSVYVRVIILYRSLGTDELCSNTYCIPLASPIQRIP